MFTDEVKDMVVERQIKRFKLACYVGLTVGVLVGVIAASILMANHHMKEVESLKEQHSDNLEAVAAEYQATCDELTEANIEINADLEEISNQLADSEQRIEDIETMQAANFQLMQRYWYLLKDAKSNSGITMELIQFVDEQCQKWDVNPDWVWHVYEHESQWTARIDNNEGSGARGLGQVMPSTGKEIWEDYLGHGEGTFSADMLYDPYVNAEISIALIGKLLNYYGNMHDTLGHYSGCTDTYYNTVVSMAAEHGITLSEDNVHYPA